MPFRVLFVLVILAHERRRGVHFNVTEAPDGGVDGATGRGGLPLGRGPALSPTRSKPYLWASLSAARPHYGHQGSQDRTAITMAESLCGTPHWEHPAGVSGPCGDLERATSATHPGQALGLLLAVWNGISPRLEQHLEPLVV
jgi:hypothetical protein